MNLTFEIINKNKILDFKKLNLVNDYVIIPIGFRCGTALSVKYSALRKFSLPFDWVVPLYPKKIIEVLKNNFKDYIPDVYNNNFINKYGLRLAHFNKDINKGINEYERRIKRFNNLIKSNKKLIFVYINEDYLFLEKYRDEKFLKKFFLQMIEFESFIKSKYKNINYNILYFDFYKHNISSDSNIINIVLNTKKIFKSNDGKANDELRYFCSKILCEIFNTSLTITKFDKDTFNN